ncbi:hypothetical protein GGQ74_001487 [Desulfobaculum xiamenense]|uniref:Uncharacterized protein n=1 Tax=Desulfobaculum xiamenense TaxID=995050 RepID=A0A846QKZ4_9BACT|nr:hypothetical protein [Desulfobaculum xiamenense]NJB67847.1 hypothetical protein [Desulfobaculum xiamenense]
MNTNTSLRRGLASALRMAGGTLIMLCLLNAIFIGAAFASGSGSMLEPKARSAAEPSVPENVLAAVEGLIGMTKDPSRPFDAAAAAPLLDFVAESGRTGDMTLPDRDGANGVCVSETIGSPLSRILQYGYNPEIPAYVVLPSVVRVSGWYPGSDMVNSRPRLWEQLESLTEPVVLRGREFEQITPDVFSGGYYSYDLSRLLVLTRHNGRGVLISISRQDGPSSVGRKGAVLDDASWHYLYSNEEGLTKGGIGWMDTYMYDSASVSVYVEGGADSAQTSTMVFKWLKAGWSGINVVRPKHIITGCRRFTEAFRQVMESDRLPDATAIACKVREFMTMTNDELESMLQGYAREIESRWGDNPLLRERTFARLMKGDSYIAALSRDERISLLIKGYLRSALGVS